MKSTSLKDIFLNEKLLRDITIFSVVSGLISLVMLLIYKELTLITAFERIVKLLLTVVTLWSFSSVRWDITKGIMGSLLFALVYQESYLVLGNLWGGTTDFDFYLIMGVQGSLYLAAQSMNFMMTIIIIINHFVIGYSNISNWRNVILNQISIVFKICLYLLLLVINVFLKMPAHQQVIAGFEYASDLNIIIMLICIEIQFDNFKALKHDLRMAKKQKESSHE